MKEKRSCHRFPHSSELSIALVILVGRLLNVGERHTVIPNEYAKKTSNIAMHLGFKGSHVVRNCIPKDFSESVNVDRLDSQHATMSCRASNARPGRGAPCS